MPSQQEIVNWAETLRTFNDVTIPALYGFILFVALLIGGYFLRGMFGRDKRRDDLLTLSMQANTKMDTAIESLRIASEKGDSALIDALKENTRTVSTALDNSTSATTALTTWVQALDGRTGRGNRLLEEFGATIEGKASAAQVENLTRLVNEINTYICEAIPKLTTRSEFDAAIGRLETVQQVTQDAIRQCVEKKKKVTDENPIALLPTVEQPTEKKDGEAA